MNKYVENKLREAIQILLKQHDEILAEDPDAFPFSRELAVCEKLWELLSSALEGEESK